MQVVTHVLRFPAAARGRLFISITIIIINKLIADFK